MIFPNNWLLEEKMSIFYQKNKTKTAESEKLKGYRTITMHRNSFLLNKNLSPSKYY